MTFKQIKVVGVLVGAVVTTYLATKAVKKVKEDLAVHEAKVDKAIESGEKMDMQDINNIGKELIKDVAPTLVCGLLTGLLAYSVYKDIEGIDVEYVDHYIPDPNRYYVSMSKTRTDNTFTAPVFRNPDVGLEEKADFAFEAIDRVKDHFKSNELEEMTYYDVAKVMSDGNISSSVEDDELNKHMFLSADKIDDIVIAFNEEDGGIFLPSFTVDDIGAEILKDRMGKDAQIDDESVNNTKRIFMML